MYYYSIIIRGSGLNLNNLLTYHSNKPIKIGSLVSVAVLGKEYIGLIVKKSTKPKFKTNPIILIYALPPLNKSALELLQWLKAYYPTSYSSIIKLFVPNKIVAVNKLTDSPKKQIIKLPSLNLEQTKIISKINKDQTYLLHGITGSGKTRIYQELTKQNIQNNKSVIILTPEIYLTTKLYQDFLNITESEVYLIHSKLSLTTKQKIWFKVAQSKDPIILIGPRSALFYPINNLGLIVVDEFHDNSYKSENHPKYQTIRVAATLRKYTASKLILGSATPSITEYYLAKQKNRAILELKQTAINKKTNKLDYKIVDLKNDKNFNTSKIISNQLLDSISLSLSSKEQSLLFLNRRGTSRLILCKNCGWENLCKNCNLPLVYHKDKNYLICHSCKKIYKDVPFSCPICNSTDIIYKTAGIKAVQEEIEKIFPNAKVVRIDSDSKTTDHLQSYKDIVESKVDIIVGTQLITKGLDLQNLSTVGLIQADSSLYIPDYASKEKTYQLITQVLGRTNRGHKNGRLIIQTHNPDSSLIRDAINQNYQNFYNLEIADRQKYKFPPFYFVAKLTNQKASPLSAKRKSDELVDNINKTYANIIIEGPSPPYHEKTKNKYKSQIILKSKSRSTLTKIISSLPSGWNYDIDPNDLL